MKYYQPSLMNQILNILLFPYPLFILETSTVIILPGQDLIKMVQTQMYFIVIYFICSNQKNMYLSFTI